MSIDDIVTDIYTDWYSRCCGNWRWANNRRIELTIVELKTLLKQAYRAGKAQKKKEPSSNRTLREDLKQPLKRLSVSVKKVAAHPEGKAEHGYPLQTIDAEKPKGED